MVEVNPQDIPAEEKDVNIYVAQTAGTSKDADAVLEPARSWISIRAFAEEEVRDHGQPLDGDLVFAEVNNIPKDIAISLLKMVLDTIENGEQIDPEEEGAE